MKRLLRKALRWAGILLATLIVLLLAFYAEEDWRGARDWAACQRDLAARGETLDLRQLIPPGKPQDDLSKVPIFAELYKDYDKPFDLHGEAVPITPPRIDDLKIDLGAPSGTVPKANNYFKGGLIDLAAWQMFYRSNPKAKLAQQASTPAQDVLQSLSQFDPEIKEIDSAVSNPKAYWPIKFERPFDTFLGSATRMISVAKILQLRAVAELDNQQSDLAEQDFILSFRLNHPLFQRCFLVDYLIAVGVRTISNSILWEGLSRHAWTNAQLQEMESALNSENLLALAPKAFRTERASGVRSMMIVQSQGPSLFKDEDLYDEAEIEVLCNTWHLRPAGWWNQDRLHYAYGMQTLIDNIDPNRGSLISEAFDNKKTRWEEIYTPLAATALPANDGAGVMIARAETYRRLARLACRLEEYRLAHNNQYPDQLDDLPDLPAHLNQEVLSTQPLQYHRQGDGYTLYSLGWNQKDDGGTYNPDPKQGDWPWPSP